MADRIVFVHGWSVPDTVTYGGLPERLAREIPGLTTHHLWLSKYVSFRGEVRMNDVALAMEAAVQREFPAGARFAVITHSTGGPVVRTWWHRYYLQQGRTCPMTHVIHLAAAHFGSALAQLGKGRLGKLKSFLEAIEPGQGILDWLELGSPESLALHREWVDLPSTASAAHPVFSFCLSGQQIDRKFYDHLNSYTGEMGSDGTVRVASANLNSAHVRLVQETPSARQLATRIPSALVFDSASLRTSQEVAFSLIPGASHSGPQMGILRSVKTSGPIPPVVRRIKEALAVTGAGDYQQVVRRFREETRRVHEAEAVEVERNIFQGRIFFHDPCSMVVIRVRDEEGNAPKEFRIVFTGPDNNPNHLPEGFLIDRQKNSRDRGVVTFFFNCAAMLGSPARTVKQSDGRNKVVRPRLKGISALGICIEADPDEGFVHFHPAQARASAELLQKIIRPDETTVVDVILRRIVHENTFSLTRSLKPSDFRKTPPGEPV